MFRLLPSSHTNMKTKTWSSCCFVSSNCFIFPLDLWIVRWDRLSYWRRRIMFATWFRIFFPNLRYCSFSGGHSFFFPFITAFPELRLTLIPTGQPSVCFRGNAPRARRWFLASKIRYYPVYSSFLIPCCFVFHRSQFSDLVAVYIVFLIIWIYCIIKLFHSYTQFTHPYRFFSTFSRWLSGVGTVHKEIVILFH